jgi:predicted transcriptional regulator
MMGNANARIVQAVHHYGYSQGEVADFLDLHYAAVSRLANRP